MVGCGLRHPANLQVLGSISKFDFFNNSPIRATDCQCGQGSARFPKCSLGARCLRGLCLATRLLNHSDGQRETQLHDVVDQNLDMEYSGDGKLDLGEDTDVGCVLSGVAELKSDGTFPQNGCAVRMNQSSLFDELAKPGCPPIEEAELLRRDRYLRHSHQTYNAHKDEIATGLLPHVFTNQGALQVGQNHVRFHKDAQVSNSRGMGQSRKQKNENETGFGSYSGFAICSPARKYSQIARSVLGPSPSSTSVSGLFPSSSK